MNNDQDEWVGPVTIGGEPPMIEIPAGALHPLDDDQLGDLTFDATEAAFEG